MPTINSSRVVDASICEPAFGRWYADIESDSKEDITGEVTINLDGVTYKGTVYRGGVYSNRWIGRVVGGANGISNTLDAKAYYTAPLQSVLDDVMSETSETLSSDSESLLSWPMAHWQRMRAPGTHVMLDIANTTGYAWRFDREGEVLLTEQEYTTSAVVYSVVDENPALGNFIIAPVTGSLVEPSTTVGGYSVNYVVTFYSASGTRQELWYE